jgi:acetyl esterase/lipase
MRKKLILFYTIIIVTALTGAMVEARVYNLYYLGGQSNMDGHGQISELPDDLNKPVKGVMIFHGNTAPDGGDVDGRGIWAELQPGHGGGFKSDGISNKYSKKIGVELTFAHRLLELEPNSHIAIIKYSRGGTSIDTSAARKFGSWDPDYNAKSGVNQYDHFLATVKNALSISDIDGDGEPDKLVPTGILWMQGESDAANKIIAAQKYEANLKRLMNLIRAALRLDDLPVVIGRISDSGQDETDGKVWNHGDIVRQAQKSFVEKDANAALVTSTDNYGYSDKWHYDTKGYLDLGKEFSQAIFSLQNDLDSDSNYSFQDFVYKTLADTELRLYLFKSKQDEYPGPKPAIVFFHGGGWRNGPPSQFFPHCKYFASRGMVAISVSYRLKNIHGTTPFDCVKDGKSAMRWVRLHADELDIDPNRIAAGGGSAGGHIAGATAILDGLNEEGEDVEVSCKPNALVLFNPVLDNGPGGYGYERLGNRYKEISPMHNIKSDLPPMIIFLGTLDGAFPVLNAEKFKELMDQSGNRCELKIYQGQKHGFFNYRDGKNEYFYKTVFDADIFLESIGYLNGEPTILDK